MGKKRYFIIDQSRLQKVETKDQAEAFLAALKDLGMGEENF
jgi:hypothetical protein